MEQEKEKLSNRSYLYQLNEELSGRAELEPYFFANINEGEILADREEGKTVISDE